MGLRDDLQQAAPAGRERDGHEHCGTQTEPHNEQTIQVRLEGPLRQREESEHVLSIRKDWREPINIAIVSPLRDTDGLEGVIYRVDLCGERVASMA